MNGGTANMNDTLRANRRNRLLVPSFWPTEEQTDASGEHMARARAHASASDPLREHKQKVGLRVEGRRKTLFLPLRAHAPCHYGQLFVVASPRDVWREGGWRARFPPSIHLSIHPPLYGFPHAREGARVRA